MALVVAATASISSRILCLMRQPGLRPKAYDIIINTFASDYQTSHRVLVVNPSPARIVSTVCRIASSFKGKCRITLCCPMNDGDRSAKIDFLTRPFPLFLDIPLTVLLLQHHALEHCPHHHAAINALLSRSGPGQFSRIISIKPPICDFAPMRALSE